MVNEVKAPIFDVQRFSIHDGPGIRTLVFLKGCKLRCAWCQNPESQQPKPIVAFYSQRCNNTHDCFDVCPENAISLSSYRIDHDKCTQCLKCIDACAYNAIELIGETLSVDDLYNKIMADAAYYKSSQGGVTFTGGEATLYPKFMDEIISRCFSQNIHTVLETCGTYSHVRWKDTFKKIQLIYFDLKIMDAQTHIISTGADNKKILSNAKLLVEENYPVEFRLALIEGYTDDQKNVDAIMNFLCTINHKKLHLLKYHNMGESKIDIINGSQKRLGLNNYNEEKFQCIKAQFVEKGFDIIDYS